MGEALWLVALGEWPGIPMSRMMFWRSSKGLLAVVPTTAILSYLLLMYASKENDGPVVRMDSGGKQFSSREGALEERELAQVFANPASGPRIQNGQEPWRIGGWVRNEEGRPFPDVFVQVGVDKFGLHRPIANTTTDSRGHWSLSLDPIKGFSAAFRDGSRLKVRFQAKDYSSLDRLLEMPPLSSSRFSPEMAVALGGGCKISGRVLDRHRRPVRDAQIYLSGPEQRKEFFDRTPKTKTDSFGRFDVFVRNPGEYILEAFKPGTGSSKRQIILVRRQKLIQTQDLHVGSGEEIGGSIQYEDGTPVSLAFLLARITPEPVGRKPRDHADRLEEGRFWTDSMGRFRLGGLESGQYAIGDPIGSMQGFATLLDTRRPGSKITVHRQRLKLQIVDRDDWALPGTKVHIAIWTGKDAELVRGIHRESGDLGALMGRASRRGFLRLRAESGELDLWVEKGAYCWIRLSIPGALPLARGILMDPDVNEVQLKMIVQNR